MVTFTHAITGLTCKPSVGGLFDVVINVQWLCLGTDGVFSTSMSGNTDLPDPDPVAFKPLEDLTKEVVLNWIHTHTDPTVLAYCTDQITRWILEQHAPPIVHVPVPWGEK